MLTLPVEHDLAGNIEDQQEVRRPHHRKGNGIRGLRQDAAHGAVRGTARAGPGQQGVIGHPVHQHQPAKQAPEPGQQPAADRPVDLLDGASARNLAEPGVPRARPPHAHVHILGGQG
ncbi:hypothetical protein DQ354_11910 [Arthrobacter sp. AQ5-06]|nr:hypothetical protein DQ354_11910 [Arthrobacter sp. AQ5-06]